MHKIITPYDDNQIQSLIHFIRQSFESINEATPVNVAQFILNGIYQYALHIQATPQESLATISLPCSAGEWKAIANRFEKEIKRYVQPAQ